ncbi:hydantoinase/oxoprolinase family protein [Acidobacteria bacterium AB60]|nr:hydantoinase/oxoprolinase family protein [Acidobacteria bacterium AB60]
MPPRALAPTSTRVAIDTGGTFTDCVTLRDGKLAVLKVFSTPHDPGAAVLEGLRQLGAASGVVVRHGTTVGTNTMLERTGARVAFITTRGFEDTLAIGRQARPRLYDWFQPPPPCLVPPELRFGVAERIASHGECLQPIDPADLAALVHKVRAAHPDSLAISLLFSFANPRHEQELAAALAPLDLPLSLSHKILPEFREYERASTVVANAYLAPRVGAYLRSLAAGIEQHYRGARLEVMQSSGGILPAPVAAAEPVRTVLSGPAGGVVGAWKLASAAGFDRIIAFDMGGTSTDVSLIDGSAGGLRISHESTVAGIPIAVPMLDIHTAGAGGGSIARFDAGGLLHVGPESAGSVPGPLCFGRGERPTVTDANLLLGRLDTQNFLGGAVTLDLPRTRRFLEHSRGPLATVEEFAAGILDVIEASMARAIRVISIEKGHDPRDFTLVAFGGGGPLHACALARALSIPRVLIPALPGALSAVGILLADTMREYSRTVMLPLDADLEEVFAALERQATEDFALEGLEGALHRSADLRYQGQGYDLNLPCSPTMAADFHSLHQRRYGFRSDSRPIEIVNLRVRIVAPAPPFEPAPEPLGTGNGSQALVSTRPAWFHGAFRETPIYNRDRLAPGDTLAGPALISEYSSATVLPPGDTLRVDALRNLLIHIERPNDS